MNTGLDPWHHHANGCEAVTPIRTPPRFRGKPSEAYSRVSDPTRYDVLHEVGGEQIERLVSEYSPQRQDHAAYRPRLLINGPAFPATTLTPQHGASPLTFILTTFGLDLEFGYGGTDRFPICGCDACDEDPGELAYRMAEVAGAVVAGGFSETRRRRFVRRDTYERRLTKADGGWESAGPTPISPELALLVPVGITRWEPWKSAL